MVGAAATRPSRVRPSRRRTGQRPGRHAPRLESVGGRLDVRRREDAARRPTFTVTAWVPVRSRVASDVPEPIRVLLVDDQELFREGVAVIVDAQDGMEVVGHGGRRPRGGAAGRRARARRGADGHPDAGDGRRRGDPADLPAASGSPGAAQAPVRVVVLTTFNLDDRAATAIRLRRQRVPAQGHHAGACCATRSAPCTPATPCSRRATCPRCWTGSSARPRPTPAAYLTLTDKEREVFAAVARGLSNTEIAALVFASESTVKTHVGAILRKLGLRDRVQIVVFAHEHGLV